MNAALCELIDQPGIDSTEAELTLIGLLTCAFDVIKDPADLRAGKIRVKLKAGLLLELLDDTRNLCLHLLCEVSGTAALPYDCVVNRLPCRTIPYDDRLTLVGDTDRCNIRRRCTNLRHRLTCDRELCLPDFIGIMLYPARLREILCELLLCHGAHLTLLVEQDTPVTGCTRVECHYILCHINPPFKIVSLL